MGRLTRRYPVLRVQPGSVRRSPDTVAVEEPLEIRLDGTPFVVTMRTPGDDIDLVHGLLHSEGIIDRGEDVSVARYCDGAGVDGLNTYNVLDVALTDSDRAPEPGLRRNVLTTSACGMCGTTSIDEVVKASAYPSPTGSAVRDDVLVAAPELLRAQQATFARTGGVHGAGLMTLDGVMVCVREDVGRHNAVDKVIGWAIREGRLPLATMVLVVSSRASFELTQKAVLAGIPTLAAVSAPSSMAVELAQKSGLTLLGFVRGGSMNVYAHPERVLLSETGAT